MSTANHLPAYFHLHGFIPSSLLVALCVGLLVRARRSVWRIAVLALPGTLAHELAHLLVGLLLNARPTGFSVWPQRAGNGWTLGTVSFRNIGILNGALVAFAPLLLLPLAWLCLMHIALPAWTAGHWAWWLLAGYLSASILFAALPSSSDVKLGFASLLLYLTLGGLLWMILPSLPSWLRF